MKQYRIWLLRLIPIICILALIICLSEIFYQSLMQNKTEECWEELAVTRDETATEIGDRINTNIGLLDLAADAILINTDFEEEETMVSYLTGVQRQTIFDRIDIIFSNETILVQTTGDYAIYRDEISYYERFDMGVHISARVDDFLTGVPAIRVYSPVRDAADHPVAILCATVSCATLSELFVSSHYEGDVQLFLVDRNDGNLVVDNMHGTPGSIYDMRSYQTPGETDFITEILDGKTGRISYTSPHYDQAVYTIYTPVDQTPYSLVMVVREEVIMGDLYRLRNTLTWVGLVEIGLLLLLVIWVYFIMLRSMQNERRAAEAELALLHQKEAELEKRYADADGRREFLEAMAINLPGGYHRCTTDHNFRVTFMSNSFTEITGYSMKEMEEELGGSYMGIVLSEDREYFLSLAPLLESEGYIHCAYRIRRRDGSVRWVMDTTQYVERDQEKYYQCALMDISERVEELERAKQAAEASSNAKSTFLFNISHDIRTPMNAINGFSHIIAENADDPALVRETVAKLRQAGTSLMMLINDVLDIARIERGKEELHLELVDLNEAGKNLYEMFSADMKTAGIDFVVEGEAFVEPVYCDKLKLTRIMMNMLSNAKKFTPAGGTVTFGAAQLSCEGDLATYRFYVRDTGIGMSPEFLNRAFEQFERERTSTQSRVAGSGLGLAIIKMMVELMGGTVDIQSELGKGTEISATVTLKLARKETDESKNAGASSVLLSGKRVLLVEDNDFNREIAKYVLEGLELAVEEAENGAVALKKLSCADADFYDLVLMDIQMPVMDGYTATLEIRKLEDREKAAVPIVAMTANAFEEDRQRCIEIGMNAHIGKPIDMEDLKKVLSEILK